MNPWIILVIVLLVIALALVGGAAWAGNQLVQQNGGIQRDPLAFTAMRGMDVVPVSLPANTCVHEGGLFAYVTNRGYNIKQNAVGTGLDTYTWADIILTDGRQATMTWINAEPQSL